MPSLGSKTSMAENLVVVHLTNGFGNNLFQLIAGRLLAEKYKRKLRVLPPWPGYYGIGELSKVLIDEIEILDASSVSQAIVVNDENYETAMSYDHGDIPNCVVLVKGYFEDYRYFINNREMIKSWFRPVDKRNKTDLIFHFRTGDRLFMKNEFEYKLSASSYRSAIDRFDFDKLHIVSDLPSLRRYGPKELASLTFHNRVDPRESVDCEVASSYLNSVVDTLLELNPVFQPSTISEDFNKVRSFDKIMFEHGTMSWWAAFLSEATCVGVRENWRPWKRSRNKNLSKVPIFGWFEWS